MTDLLELIAQLPSPKKALKAVRKTKDRLDEEWEYDRRDRYLEIELGMISEGDYYDLF